MDFLCGICVRDCSGNPFLVGLSGREKRLQRKARPEGGNWPDRREGQFSD